MEGLNLTDKPHLIWNCDEMAKNFEHEPVKVVAERGDSCVSRTSSKSTNITVMACVNASGRRMPPMFIVKGKTSRSLHGFNTASAPLGSRWFFQSNGWMDDSIGEKWFNEVFLECCGPERPQLLILDGHSSHETLAIVMRALEENVHLLALPPHTTHALQPLDKAVFGPVNRKYNESCSQFLQENPLHQVNKWTFPALFRDAWDNGVTSTNIRNGFRACGIYPYDPHVIPQHAYGPCEPTDLPVDVTVPIHSEASASDIGAQPATNSREPTEITAVPSDDAFKSDIRVQSATKSRESTEIEAVPSNDDALLMLNRSFSVSADMGSDLSPMLDIGDPAQLLELISDGSILMDPITDADGNDVIIPPEIGEQITTESPEGTSVEQQIENAFIPPALITPIIRQRASNKVTSHRLLTSDDIVNEKVRKEKVKAEKLFKKQERAMKPSKRQKQLKQEK